MSVLRLAASVMALLVVAAAHGATCKAEDFERHISGASQCLLMRLFGSTSEPAAMVVWLHGDVSSGGPANYHFAAAQAAAAVLSDARVLSVALVRPGYPDGSGDSSSVALLHGGRWDHYTKENLTEVGTAIERLKSRYRPRTVVVVGHSGGAATAATLLGLMPGLIDAAVLVSCPCDLIAWRAGRWPWGRSENPMAWVGRIPAASTRVVAITGDRDDNTPPALARNFIDALRSRGADARLVVLAEQTHNGAFRAPEVIGAVQQLVLHP